jgi:hypothetical protein
VLVAEKVLESTILNTEYECDEVSSDEFHIAAPIPKILISQMICDYFGISAALFPAHLVGISSTQHREISRYVCQFIENRKHGESEDGMHGRDNYLFDIICYISGMEAQRNTVAFSTKHLSRTDVYMSKSGLPPLVHVEEKARSGGMCVAQTELSNKFVALPHYDREVKFIIGIAIAGNDVMFGKLHLTGQSWEPLGSFSLRGMLGKIECVRAAINVGRWARYILNRSSMICAVDHSLGTADTNERRSLTLLPEGIIVKKYFLKEDPSRRKKLVSLYTTIAMSDLSNRIPYMEWAIECHEDETKGTISLRLKPFGVVATCRWPRSLCELREALKCVFTCLSALHAVGWAHLDLRWPNVVFLAPREWYVIDAEHARPFGDPLPDTESIRKFGLATTSHVVDCYLVGRMMHDSRCEVLAGKCESFDQLRKFLSPPNDCTAAKALQSVFFQESS